MKKMRYNGRKFNKEQKKQENNIYNCFLLMSRVFAI